LASTYIFSIGHYCATKLYRLTGHEVTPILSLLMFNLVSKEVLKHSLSMTVTFVVVNLSLLK